MGQALKKDMMSVKTDQLSQDVPEVHSQLVTSAQEQSVQQEQDALQEQPQSQSPQSQSEAIYAARKLRKSQLSLTEFQIPGSKSAPEMMLDDSRHAPPPRSHGVITLQHHQHHYQKHSTITSGTQCGGQGTTRSGITFSSHTRTQAHSHHAHVRGSGQHVQFFLPPSPIRYHLKINLQLVTTGM